MIKVGTLMQRSCEVKIALSKTTRKKLELVKSQDEMGNFVLDKDCKC